ncbi:hypothetical protein P152DRAFT_479259 [Eremomyces bilateralis CBS 781.70]|uniref:DUF7580 domain-containing protein n=1 Tax=Eremomyces bilateralis CBS 781.70 TaxID=1392243 RepID=A0A6G1GBN3_9PEZI|nr:uncharacterized protein P152DRAFT_479259 [Eremomyces bilateralis CBS 781.70]KAF1815310.1 hypothetical protein P152DRAFT_479259 [Eremomyces bilateralis CBS 781.70]
MSGVEVASLALAVLPVFIYAAEHLKGYGIKQEEFLMDLKFEVAFLNMNLQTVVKSLAGIPDERRQRLLSIQNAQDMENIWRSEDIVQALKIRLDPGFDLFLDTLKSILEHLEKLLANLSTMTHPKDSKGPEDLRYTCANLYKLCAIPQSDLTRFDKIFAIHKHRRNNRILDTIQKYNEKLERIILRSSSSWFEPTSSSELGRRRSRHLIELRPLLRTLYTTLGGLWPCDCPQRHEARLCLLKCRDSEDTEHEYVYFDFLMSLRTEEASQYCKWVEGKLRIELEHTLQEDSTRTVRFHLDDQASMHSSTVTESPTSPSSSTPLIHSGRRRSIRFAQTKIEQLCEILALSYRHTNSPEILFDGSSLWHVTSRRPVRRQSLKQRLGMDQPLIDTSLAILLSGERKFSLRDKKILSVTLAHSLLQFCEGPWLSKEWSKEHISFLHQGKDDLLDPDLRRPYVSTLFLENEIEETPDELYRTHPNPSVLALGILLLEIEFDSTIESKRQAEDYGDDGRPTINTDLFAASRLLNDVEEDVYINHKNAVSACLYCNFYDGDDFSLDNPDFRQAVYDNIVAPLEDELYHAYKLTSDDIGLN